MDAVYNHVQRKAKQACSMACHFCLFTLAVMVECLIYWVYSVVSGSVSFLGFGTATVSLIIWCFVITVVKMTGIIWFLSVMAMVTPLAVFRKARISIAVIGITFSVFLVMHQCFMITAICISTGVLALELGYDQFPICSGILWSSTVVAKQVGFLGLVLGINLAFATSELLRRYFGPSTTNQPQEQPQGAASSPNGDSAEQATTDRLRKARLLDYVHEVIQNSPIGKAGLASMFARFRDECEGSHAGLFRLVNCLCGELHPWLLTSRPISRARWCQGCDDFHPASEGDGWIEQLYEPILFGLLHMKRPLTSYVCVDGRVYNCTHWYFCQRLHLPAHSHLPCFHFSFLNGTRSNGGTESGPRDGGRRSGVNSPTKREDLVGLEMQQE